MIEGNPREQYHQAFVIMRSVTVDTFSSETKNFEPERRIYPVEVVVEKKGRNAQRRCKELEENSSLRNTFWAEPVSNITYY